MNKSKLKKNNAYMYIPLQTTGLLVKWEIIVKSVIMMTCIEESEGIKNKTNFFDAFNLLGVSFYHKFSMLQAKHDILILEYSTRIKRILFWSIN